jgi:hypothetical protein
MTRDELIRRTRQLIAEGERLERDPSLNALTTWLQLSDDLLAHAWGTMDRYHLAWLMVGKPKDTIRGRAMTPDEEASYVREVASQKTAALRMSLDAVERKGMPFVGETGGIGAGQGMGEVPAAPGTGGEAEDRATADTGAVERTHADLARDPRRAIPLDPELQRRLDEARRAAAGHDHEGHQAHAGPGGEAAARRAPRPERLQR